MKGALRALLALPMLFATLPTPALAAQEGRSLSAAQRKAPSREPSRQAAPRRYDMLSPWSRMNIAPENELPAPPQTAPMPERGRSTCIIVENIGTAQLVGDSAVALTMNNGQNWRMILAQECPGITFYHGFYYRPGRDGTLCAGRDVIGARSGGECAIASIVEMAPPQDRSAKGNDGDNDSDSENER